MNEISREAKELVENVSDVIEPVQPTTNCSQLEKEKAFYIVTISYTNKKNQMVHVENCEHENYGESVGSIEREDGVLNIGFGDWYNGYLRLTPSELRQLADLVEETLEKGGKP